MNQRVDTIAVVTDKPQDASLPELMVGYQVAHSSSSCSALDCAHCSWHLDILLLRLLNGHCYSFISMDKPQDASLPELMMGYQ
eukprot:2308499-Ditylum_brightwellii.AAC.1